MARIFLIRHGETSANSEKRYQGQIDTPLNSTGLRQAKELAKTLLKVPFKRFYASHLRRAVETAQAIAGPRHQPIKRIPELCERNFGAWENLTFLEIKKLYPKIYKEWQRTPYAAIPQAEPFQKFKKRVLAGLQKIMRELNADKNILIVAHGGTTRVILHYFLGLDERKNFWKVKQDNACINIIDVEHKYHLVSLMNYHQKNLMGPSIKY